MNLSVGHDGLTKAIAKGLTNEVGLTIYYTDANSTAGQQFPTGWLSATADYDGTNGIVNIVINTYGYEIDAQFTSVAFPIEINRIEAFSSVIANEEPLITLEYGAGELTATDITDLKAKIGIIRATMKLIYTNPLPPA